MGKRDMKFERLISEAVAQEFRGWDFSFIAERYVDHPPSWDYRQCISEYVNSATSLLDMGTGGGEFLASLVPLPQETFATEAYPPNISIAKARLEPLGVQVVEIQSDDRLPFDDEQFELVINRHEAFSAKEVFRILKPGGRFITQQVGGENTIQLNELLQETVSFEHRDWGLSSALTLVQQAGFQVLVQKEEFPETMFYDVGAVVYYLKAIPWQIPDFTIEECDSKLKALHNIIEETGALVVKNHRFYFEAIKPVSS